MNNIQHSRNNFKVKFNKIKSIIRNKICNFLMIVTNNFKIKTINWKNMRSFRNIYNRKFRNLRKSRNNKCLLKLIIIKRQQLIQSVQSWEVYLIKLYLIMRLHQIFHITLIFTLLIWAVFMFQTLTYYLLIHRSNSNQLRSKFNTVSNKYMIIMLKHIFSPLRNIKILIL